MRTVANTYLSGMYLGFDFDDVVFSNVRLVGDFTGSSFQHCIFRDGCVLSGSFDGAEFINAYFSDRETLCGTFLGCSWNQARLPKGVTPRSLELQALQQNLMRAGRR